ncbi:MAG: hypothetical protein LIP28_06755, partial [Deltaproteobacteria bacterium]|nr:hypothetical protein [Deltaproteobacteria bacterium]
ESVVMAAMGGGRKLRGPEEDGAAVWFLSGMVPPALRAERGCRDGSAAYGNLPVAQAFDCVLALSLLGRPEFAGKLAVCEERNATVRSLVTLSGGSA